MYYGTSKAFLVCLCVVLPFFNVIRAQEYPDYIDQFGLTIADRESARLDNFAIEIVSRPDSIGYIVAHGSGRAINGDFLRKVYGFQDYLINKRGVNSNQLKIIIGVFKENMSFELSVLPRAAAFSPPTVPQLKIKSRFEFDEIQTGINCEPEYTLDLTELKDAIKFYAEVLQEYSSLKAEIIVYPSYKDKLGKVKSIADQAEDELIKDYKIAADRVKTTIKNKRRICRSFELWLVP